MIAEGITPRQTKFETNKEKLRQTIRAALSAATSFEDFSSLLLREGCDRQGEPGAAFLPYAGQDKAHYCPQAGRRL